MSGRVRRTLEDRFWEKVDKSGDCWVWTAAKQKGGYGKIGISGRGQGVTESSHRVSWMLHNGDIPENLEVLHTCDNPPCVNPSHLFLGTSADNIADMDSKGRRVTADRSGSNNPNFGKHWDEAFKENQRQKLGSWFEITTPAGERIREFGLTKFAKAHNLNPGHLSMLRRGIVKSCKGYTDLVMEH